MAFLSVSFSIRWLSQSLFWIGKKFFDRRPWFFLSRPCEFGRLCSPFAGSCVFAACQIRHVQPSTVCLLVSFLKARLRLHPLRQWFQLLLPVVSPLLSADSISDAVVCGLSFMPASAITTSSWARLMDPVVSLIALSNIVSSLPSLGFSASLPKPDKTFIVGPGNAPIPAKLVKRITDGQFVELADLSSVNLWAVEQEPQTFLEGKLLVPSSKRWQMEIKDILTWVEAFTIFQMVLCAVFPHRWSELTKYKLLIIQTARQFQGLAWLEYNLAFRRDAAASGLNDWLKMNLDLYNFHLRPPAPSPLQPLSSNLPGPSQSLTHSKDSGVRLPFCHSWNEGQCQWPFGRCKFRHKCSNCAGDHSKVDCPFPGSIGLRSRSPSPGGRGARS